MRVSFDVPEVGAVSCSPLSERRCREKCILVSIGWLLLLLLLVRVQVIDFFLRQKWELDQKDNPSMEDITGVCHALTTARALLLGGLNR